MDAGAGTVTAASYEYGNTFLIDGRPAELPGHPRRVRHRDGAQVTRVIFWLMVLFAFFVSLVFAVLLRDEPREQLQDRRHDVRRVRRRGLVLGWLMFPFPL